MSPNKKKIAILNQVCKMIPKRLVTKLARKYGVDKQSRKFTPWSHVLTLIYAQLSHAISLNDVCDALRNHRQALSEIREAVPPSRNGLSHANRNRNPEMAKALFTEVLAEFKRSSNDFGFGHGYCGIPKRFKRTINAIDSSTIKLFANCIDWAKHRRRKAAAKMHLTLDLKTFLPKVVIVKAANTHDSTEAAELCANMKAGEIVVWDKAYNKYDFLYKLHERRIYWVCRAKDNMKYEEVKELNQPKGKILKDQFIRFTDKKSAQKYPGEVRLVKQEIEVNGKVKEITFITNNKEWSASSVGDLYKSRWGIELFFKQIKQTLQISDFMGYNENAVQWQVWTALTTYLILRFIGHTRKWSHSFPRLFTVIRGVIWSRLDLDSVLQSCGTATDPIRIRAAPEQGFIPGFNELTGKA